MIIAVIYYPGRFSFLGMGTHVVFAAHDHDPYSRRTIDGVFLDHGGTGSHCANKKYYGGKPKIILLPIPIIGITLDKLNKIISDLYDVRGNYNLLRNNCAHMVAAMLAKIHPGFGEIFRTDCSRLALTPEEVANHAEVLEELIKKELGDDLYNVCYVDPDQKSIKLFQHALENAGREEANPHGFLQRFFLFLKRLAGMIFSHRTRIAPSNKNDLPGVSQLECECNQNFSDAIQHQHGELTDAAPRVPAPPPNEMIDVASPEPIKLAPLVGQQFQRRSEEEKQAEKIQVTECAKLFNLSFDLL